MEGYLSEKLDENIEKTIQGTSYLFVLVNSLKGLPRKALEAAKGNSKRKLKRLQAIYHEIEGRLEMAEKFYKVFGLGLQQLYDADNSNRKVMHSTGQLLDATETDPESFAKGFRLGKLTGKHQEYDTVDELIAGLSQQQEKHKIDHTRISTHLARMDNHREKLEEALGVMYKARDFTKRLIGQYVGD